MTYQAATGDSSACACGRGALRERAAVASRRVRCRRHRLAAAREAGIERGEIVQRQADAAERDGERRLGALSGSAGSTPTRRKRPTSLPGPTASSTFTAGMLSDCGERLADRHGAVEVLVEVLRRVGAEARRAILDQRLGMGEARLEGEAVDERLQRRARRADGAASCRWRRSGRRRDSPAEPTWARTSPVRVIDDEDGGRQLRAERVRRARAASVSSAACSVAVDGQAMDRLLSASAATSASARCGASLREVAARASAPRSGLARARLGRA